MTILYADDPTITPAEFVDVLERSGLAERRPVGDLARIAAMIEGADIIVAARDTSADGRLIGVVRSVTDFAYCCYCSDLAVDREYQGRGVGRELIAATRRRLHPACRFLLLAAPGVEGYYEAVGMTKLTRAYSFET